MFWVLVANASQAKLFSMTSRFGQNLTLIKEFEHPESRLKGSDLVSDRPGHYQSKGTGHGSFVDKTDPKTQEAERFSQELVAELESGRTSNQYKNLVLVAAPPFLGALNKHISEPLHNTVIRVIEKDLTKNGNGDLVDHLND